MLTFEQAFDIIKAGPPDEPRDPKTGKWIDSSLSLSREALAHTGRGAGVPAIYDDESAGINSALRAGLSGALRRLYYAPLIAEIDAAIASWTARTDVKVWRLVPPKLLSGLHVGDVLSDAAFVSVSSSRSRLETTAQRQTPRPSLMEIAIPAGATVAPVDHRPGDEFLLPRDTRLRYVGDGRFVIVRKATKAGFNPDEPRDPHTGRWIGGDTPPEVGQPFYVFRLGSGESLDNRNAGDARRVAEHLGRQDDLSAPGQKHLGDKIAMYEVTVHKPFGKYQGYTGGKLDRPGAVATDEVGFARGAFSFPQGGPWTARVVKVISLSDVRSVLAQRGYKNFDDSGYLEGGKAIRQAFGKAVAKGNPEFRVDQPRDLHTGRWSGGGGTSLRPGHEARDLLQRNLNARRTPTRSEFEAGLSKEQQDFLRQRREQLENETPTDRLYRHSGHWDEDRAALHEHLIQQRLDDAMERAKPAPGEAPKLVVMGGRPGSGKTTSLMDSGFVPDMNKYLYVNADDLRGDNKKFKAGDERYGLPGYEGWNSALYHTEASEMMDELEKRGRELGLNIIHDATMRSVSASERLMHDFEDAGYDISGLFVHASPENAALRAIGRGMKPGGRFVPTYILGTHVNEAAFDAVKYRMSSWKLYDANGRSGRLVAAGNKDRVTYSKAGFREDEARDEYGRWSTEPGDPRVLKPQAEPGYVYHGTNIDRLRDIRADGKLRTHGPSYGTDQYAWPDGAREKRSYWSHDPKTVEYFYPEEGKPVLLRAKQSSAKFRQESGTRDIYSRESVPASLLEYLGKDGSWHSLVVGKAYNSDEPREPKGSSGGGRWTSGGISSDRERLGRMSRREFLRATVESAAVLALVAGPPIRVAARLYNSRQMKSAWESLGEASRESLARNLEAKGFKVDRNEDGSIDVWAKDGSPVWRSPKGRATHKAGFNPDEPRDPDTGKWVEGGLDMRNIDQLEMATKHAWPGTKVTTYTNPSFVNIEGKDLTFSVAYNQKTNTVSVPLIHNSQTKEGSKATISAMVFLKKIAEDTGAGRITLEGSDESGGFMWPRMGFDLASLWAVRGLTGQVNARLDKGAEWFTDEQMSAARSIVDAGGLGMATKLAHLNSAVPLDAIKALTKGTRAYDKPTLGKALLMGTNAEYSLPRERFGTLGRLGRR